MPYITRCPKISNGLLPKAIQAASRMAQHFSNVSPWRFLCVKNIIILHALVYVESRMEPSSGVCVYVLQVIYQKAVVQSLQCLQDWSAFLKVVVSPWCNNNGWLGIKHQVSYLLLKVLVKPSLIWNNLKVPDLRFYLPPFASMVSSLSLGLQVPHVWFGVWVVSLVGQDGVLGFH